MQQLCEVGQVEDIEVMKVLIHKFTKSSLVWKKMLGIIAEIKQSTVCMQYIIWIMRNNNFSTHRSTISQVCL